MSLGLIEKLLGAFFFLPHNTETHHLNIMRQKASSATAIIPQPAPLPPGSARPFCLFFSRFDDMQIQFIPALDKLAGRLISQSSQGAERVSPTLFSVGCSGAEKITTVKGKVWCCNVKGHRD